jgi:hypothetical protein
LCASAVSGSWSDRRCRRSPADAGEQLGPGGLPGPGRGQEQGDPAGLVEAWNDDLVAQIRRCGRTAGKRLGYKIRTLTSDPRQRDDRRIAVWVVVTSSNPDDEDRIRQRSDLLISQTLNQLLG